MKKSTLSLLFVFAIFYATFAQTPGAFNYQAVVRNTSGEIVPNQNVSFKISILQNSESGTVVYTETHSAVTSAFGLANLKIGEGTVVSGTFSPAGWGSALHFIKIEIDPEGGTAFTHIGTSQLLSVPYAFHAQTVTEDNVEDADADPANELQTISLSGTQLSLSDGGGSVTLPTSGGGDNWGTQTVVSDGTLSGNGTSASPLSVVGDLTDNQTLSLSGNDLSISGGNSVSLPAGSTSPWTSSTAGIKYNSGKVGINHDPADDEAFLQIWGDNLPAIEAVSTSAVYPAIYAQNNSGTAAYLKGAVEIVDGTEGLGKVLTSDANGLASWQSPTSSSLWTKSGNNIYYNSGNVGIGTSTAPARGLVVSGQGLWKSAIGIENTNADTEWTMSVTDDSKFGITKVSGSTFTPLHLTADGQVEFKNTSGQSTLQILNNGFIGIGTDTPNQILSINGKTGNGYASFQNNTTGNTASDGLLIGSRSGTPNAYFWNYENTPILLATNNSTRMTIENDGDVVIEENLNVKGEINQTNTGSANMLPFAYGYVSSTGNLTSGTSNVTVSKLATGQYKVNVTNLTTNCVIQVSGIGTAAFILAKVNAIYTGNFAVATWDTKVDGYADCAFSFVVYKP